MKRKVYDSNPLPFSLDKKDYRQGGLNDALPFVEYPNIKGAINLERYLDLVISGNKAIQVAVPNDTKCNFIHCSNCKVSLQNTDSRTWQKSAGKHLKNIMRNLDFIPDYWPQPKQKEINRIVYSRPLGSYLHTLSCMV